MKANMGNLERKINGVNSEVIELCGQFAEQLIRQSSATWHERLMKS